MTRVCAVSRVFLMKTGFSPLLLLLLLTFFVRAMVPVGFMPDVKGQSGHVITICSGIETKEIRVDDNGQPIEETDHSSAPSCPFSFLSAAMMDGGDGPLLETVLFRADFPSPAVAEGGFFVPSFDVGHSILKQAPPRLS